MPSALPVYLNLVRLLFEVGILQKSTLKKMLLFFDSQVLSEYHLIFTGFFPQIESTK